MEKSTVSKSRKSEVQPISAETFINQALAEFPQTPKKIQQLREQYSGLKILNVEDTQGYETVKNALRDVVSTRTGVEKARKQIKQIGLNYCLAVDNKAKELTAMIVEVEEPLKAEKERIDDQIKRAEETRLRLIQEKINGRKNELFGYGATFNGMIYLLGRQCLTEDQVKDLDDEKWAFNMTLFKEESDLIEAEKKATTAALNRLAELEKAVQKNNEEQAPPRPAVVPQDQPKVAVGIEVPRDPIADVISGNTQLVVTPERLEFRRGVEAAKKVINEALDNFTNPTEFKKDINTKLDNL